MSQQDQQIADKIAADMLVNEITARVTAQIAVDAEVIETLILKALHGRKLNIQALSLALNSVFMHVFDTQVKAGALNLQPKKVIEA